MPWKIGGGGGGGGHEVILQHWQGRMQEFSRVVSTRAEGARFLGGPGACFPGNLEGLRHHFLQFLNVFYGEIESKYFFRYTLKTSQFLIAGTKTFGEDINIGSLTEYTLLREKMESKLMCFSLEVFHNGVLGQKGSPILGPQGPKKHNH